MIPKNHPRKTSLRIRNRIEQGVKSGITSPAGLIAHGRGEAFDYLLGEKTNQFAKTAIRQAAHLLKTAKHPVISVNGNTAALCPNDLIKLANILHCPLEINIFNSSKQRERKIMRHLKKKGARHVLLPTKATLPYLTSNRKYVNPKGIAQADVVFVPLEDGDRTQALKKNKKKVIVIDLNPLSRSAQHATVTLVDNVVRALPLLAKELKKKNNPSTKNFNNALLLKKAVQAIKRGI